MTEFEIYVFILCFIVFSLLTAMFTYLIYSITKMEIELIRYGHRDEAIIKEKELNKNPSQVLLWFNRVISLLLCLVLVTVFFFAIYIRATEDRPANGIPSIKVVKSESMAKKHLENKYLFENGLDNQFQMFDVIVCRHLPLEEELELYDVVVYKKDDMYIIHRIVGIEEPNEEHPNERHFLLQGDAVEQPDVFPVLYSQMQGIYEGTRIPFVGSFVLFLQSPAGWLCIILIIFAMIVTPIVDKLIEKEKKRRLGLLFPNEPEEESFPEEEVLPQYQLEMPTSKSALKLKYATSGRLCEIGTAVLNKHYQDGELVDIYSLKQKNLVGKSFKRIKIIVNGDLDKRLIVRSDAYSEKAREAIIEAGGTVEITNVSTSKTSEMPLETRRADYD